MVRLRLQRFGVRNNPFYRIVAAHSKAPRDGKHLELLGISSVQISLTASFFILPSRPVGAVNVPKMS